MFPRVAIGKFFDKEMTPYVEEWERAGVVSRDIWKKLGDQGFLCMNVSEEYGGFEADFLYSLILAEEMARINCRGVAANLQIQHHQI